MIILAPISDRKEPDWSIIPLLPPTTIDRGERVIEPDIPPTIVEKFDCETIPSILPSIAEPDDLFTIFLSSSDAIFSPIVNTFFVFVPPSCNS